MMTGKPLNDVEYFKSLAPSQLLAERGPEILVINPGSASLRIGLASQQSPEEVPHVIAWHIPGLLATKLPGYGDPLTGAIGERPRESSKGAPSPALLELRSQYLEKIEAELQLDEQSDELRKKVSTFQKASRTLSSNEDVDFKWTHVRQPVREPAQPQARRPVTKEKAAETAPSKDKEVGAGDEDRPHAVTTSPDSVPGTTQEAEILPAPLAEEESHQVQAPGLVQFQESGSNALKTEAGQGHQEGAEGEGGAGSGIDLLQTEELSSSKEEYRQFICGEEALRIPAGEPYVLRRPISRGHLNASLDYPLQQVLDDLTMIWDWALTCKLNLPPKARRQLSVVLVAPDTLESREVKELVTLLLGELGFLSLVIHQESVAAAFGNGISSACVVSLGAQVTTVACVEDGAVMPTSRIALPYGGQDISACLFWVQQQRGGWGPQKCEPLEDSQDLVLLESLKEAHCCFAMGPQAAEMELRMRTAGQPTRVFKETLSSSITVPPMGLFYPAFLAPLETLPVPHARYRIEHEDTLEEFMAAELGRRPDWADPLAANGGAAEAEPTGENGAPQERPLLGIHEAIIRSINSLGREEAQGKLFTSIQLVGGGAQMKGLVDFLEERVLDGLPANAAVNAVEVLPNRHPAAIVGWKGGAVLGVLDFAREWWVQRDDWLEGGARAGHPRRYRESTNLQTQLFWYSAALD